MKKTGQISLEYLIVVAFVGFVVIALVATALVYSAGSRDRININQLSNFANKLTTSAESVYFAGEPSKVTVSVYLPQGVQGFAVIQNSLVFTITTKGGLTTTAFPSSVPLDSGITFSLNAGLKRLAVTAASDRVYIAEA